LKIEGIVVMYTATYKTAYSEEILRTYNKKCHIQMPCTDQGAERLVRT
jgi:hypothetical protein